MKYVSWLLIILAISLSAQPGKAQDAPQTWVVSPEGPVTDLRIALAAAQDGDTIEVQGGIYPGPLLVEKSVTLSGSNWPVIDGSGQGTVVKLAAPGIVLRGFVIRNSGTSLDEENSGIAGAAPDLLIENNHLEETLFGIYLRQAEGSLILGNHILSKDLEVPRRGDPIRVWYSDHVRIEGNLVEKGRDVVLWYSAHLTVQGNQVRGGRYGLHFMYCDDATIKGNLLTENSVGAFLMYSRRMKLQDNTIAHNRGPSGYGIGLKDMDDAIITGNLFFDNRVGAHVDNSPRQVDSIGRFEGNVFGFNDIGVNMMPSVRHNQFTNNSFIDNQEQVSIAGGGQLQENAWSVANQGNFWSDYVGYDEQGDGLGDEPYRSERLFEDLTGRHPQLRLFAFSPVVQAIDFAARAVPLVKPQPKLTDDNPRMAPLVPTQLPTLPRPDALPILFVSLGLLGFALLLLRFPHRVAHFPYLKRPQSENREAVMIEINGLTKRFGSLIAVNRVHMQIAVGEAVALWGPNGAGKSTIIHCLLGLYSYQGEIRVSNLDVRTEGLAVRHMVGFVPQELVFHHDLRVEETMMFYARLKKAPAGAVSEQLHKMGLETHAAKRVGELSGGMKQRLALAIAMLADPELLILDEPTSNLDPESRKTLLHKLAALKADGKTLLFSSHRPDEVLSLADRVLVLRQGELVAASSPEHFFEVAGGRTNLSLAVSHDHLESALAVLTDRGYKPIPNGKCIRVTVDAHNKGEPINALVETGIPVLDFHVEFQGMDGDDDA